MKTDGESEGVKVNTWCGLEAKYPMDRTVASSNSSVLAMRQAF